MHWGEIYVKGGTVGSLIYLPFLVAQPHTYLVRANYRLIIWQLGYNYSKKWHIVVYGWMGTWYSIWCVEMVGDGVANGDRILNLYLICSAFVFYYEVCLNENLKACMLLFLLNWLYVLHTELVNSFLCLFDFQVILRLKRVGVTGARSISSSWSFHSIRIYYVSDYLWLFSLKFG